MGNNKHHTLGEWVVATRFWSFPVSAMPVLVGTAYCVFKFGLGIDWLNAVLALVGVVIIHAAGNVMSDYFDYKSGVDNEEAYSVQNLVFHHFDPREYFRFSVALFVVGIAIGIVLLCRSGWLLLVIGGIGVALTACYSFFKYRALGDVVIFIIFGLLVIMGTCFVVGGAIPTEVLALAIPLGIITVSVLHVNNTLDIQSDTKAGITTLASTLGRKRSVRLYIIYMYLPFVWMLLAVLVFRWLPYATLLSLLAIFPAMDNAQIAKEYFKNGHEVLIGLDKRSSMLNMVFSGYLIIAFLLQALLLTPVFDI